MDRCHLNVILHFLSICLMVALMLLLQINPRRGGKAEQAAATRDRSNTGVWRGGSSTLSSSCSQLHSARFCDDCLVLVSVPVTKLCYLLMKVIEIGFPSAFPILERWSSTHIPYHALGRSWVAHSPATSADVLGCTHAKPQSWSPRCRVLCWL